jgi:hypothetical protein
MADRPTNGRRREQLRAAQRRLRQRRAESDHIPFSVYISSQHKEVLEQLRAEKGSTYDEIVRTLVDNLRLKMDGIPRNGEGRNVDRLSAEVCEEVQFYLESFIAELLFRVSDFNFTTNKSEMRDIVRSCLDRIQDDRSKIAANIKKNLTMKY